MKKKRKKIAILGTGFLASALIAGVMVIGLFFFQFSSPIGSFEKKGDLAFEDGAYSTALQHWIRAKEKSGNLSELYSKIGNAYLKLANLDQALISFKKALEKTLRIDAQKQVIRILLAKGDIGEAEKIVSGLETRYGATFDFQMLSGDLFMLQGNFELGRNAYAKAVELSPKQVRPRLKLAICLLEQENRFEADRIVTQCRGDGIRDPVDLMLLADYYYSAEDEKRAEQAILMAIDKDPENLDFKSRLCLFYRVSGMKEKLGPYLKALVHEYPDNDGFRTMLTDHYLSLPDMDAAELMLGDLEKKKGDAFGYHLLMGKFWLLQGRYSHAVSYLKTAWEKNYNLVSAHYLLGVAYFAGGQTKLAENAFVRALMLDPYHEESLMVMAGLNYKRREYGLATQYLDRLLGQDSSHYTAWQLKGLCFLEQADYVRASQSFSRAWYLGDDVSSLFFLGQAFEAQGMVQEALKAYENVLEKAPRMYDALYGYARLMAYEGKGKQVLETIDKWIEQGRKYPALYYAAAKISLDLKSYDQCLVYIDKAMETRPVSGEFFLLLADCFRAKGDERGVENALTTCTRERPQFLNGWLHLSGYYLQKHHIDEAVEVLEQALKLFPDNPQVRGNLAWLLLEQEIDFDRAFDLARTAYDRLPGKAWLMDTLGWAYYHKKIYSQAEWMLTQAGDLSPDNGLIQYHLGMVFYRKGKLFEAREKLQAALDCKNLSPMNRDNALKVLAGPNGTRVSDNEGLVFDPETAPSLEMPTIEEDDILKPDWSNMKSF